ncbi:isoleucine--tRNA ligase, partial [Candidatus Peribacteria bacterium]|nr:isoleucine--tRNA ligase [Candidatus Peribacteria bacterium]
MFDSVDPRQSFPNLELGMLKYWQEEDIFKRSMKRREKGEVFSFYDGPPFATGLPHYGHILAGTIKDVIPRYQTMRGKHVRRRFGWDCHGLPVENEIEKEHGLKSKKDIEALGVAKFNDLCRNAVQRYTKEWKNTVERMGRWVDMDHDYRTMDPDYMESIWWVFKQLHTQGLIYEGHKPMHVCPRCQTPLSNFEVTQGYKDIQDYSVTAMFELEEGKETKEGKEKKEKKNVEKTFAIAWTTTGWTLPGNLFLAVHPETTYVTVKSEDNRFILAKDLVEKVFAKRAFTIEKEQTGKELVGLTYKPLFPYYAEQFKDKAFRIVAGDFVTTTDGTGIVHIATGYGDDDFQVGQREKTGILQHVDIDGMFKKEVTDFAGKHAKPKDDHQSGDKLIAKWLKTHDKLFASESFSHSYPHCWRCDS